MSRDAARRTMVAILAHPDDEMGFASVLAHYARQGVKVHLVTLTSGQKGFRAHIDIRDGEELGQLRREEIRNAARILGIEPPLVLDFVDQELLGSAQDEIREQLIEILGRLRPDVVVTFGPDGITGHPDHRAVSCFVTEILQAREEGSIRLFYLGLSLERTAFIEKQHGRHLLGVAPRHLTTCVSVSEADVEQGIRAIGEYRSQFAPQAMEEIQKMFGKTTRDVCFRRVLPERRQGESRETSLFPAD